MCEIQPLEEPQPPATACPISHRVAPGGCRKLSNDVITFGSRNSRPDSGDLPTLPTSIKKPSKWIRTCVRGRGVIGDALNERNFVKKQRIDVAQVDRVPQTLPTLGLSVVNIFCKHAMDVHQLPDIPSGNRVCKSNLPWSFSLATNVTCTILIGYRAWQHRRSMKSLDIVEHPRRMSADKVLSILVESGFIYCLLWLTHISGYVQFGPASRTDAGIYIYWLFNAMGNQISGMYPTLIIVIVNFKQTIWETDTVRSIQFAGQSRSGNGDVHLDPGVEVESTREWNITVQIEAPLSHHE
ncbi:hypothetical protein K438DRAFT_1768326 [Mycena galopus ATCC 62051]|nr:hypothetical protein K438DRAFT_1768326 [Mycena galopus ATCC 62051]